MENIVDSSEIDLGTPLTITLIKNLPHINKCDVERLNKFCDDNNVKILDHTEHHFILDGSYGSFKKMFNVKINSHIDGDVTYYKHDGNYVIPKTMGYIETIIGFDTFSKTKTYCRKQEINLIKSEDDVENNKFSARTTSSVAPTTTKSSRKTQNTQKKVTPKYLTSFTPIQIASLYKFKSTSIGQGQVVAIIELGGGYRSTDLEHYFSDLGLTTIPEIISIGVDGATNNPDDTSGANYEVLLDIEIVAAVAPGAKIVVYFAPNTDSGFYNAIYRAITNTLYKPCAISISWGAPEAYWNVNVMRAYNSLFSYAVSKGINVFAAAGDNGSSDGYIGNNVDFPASSPYVISCGGTTLKSDGTTIYEETVWNNNNGSATGGGYSTVFTKPTYQNSITTIKSKRGVPDLAANADPNTGYKIYIDGSYTVIGGTSAVSPLMAGYCARMTHLKGSSIGFLNTKLYTTKMCLDIVSGSNGSYRANSGWDPCSGKGRLDGAISL